MQPTTHPNASNAMSLPCDADRELIDRALSARLAASASDDNAAAQPCDPARAQRIDALLSLLDRWPAEEPAAGLRHETLAAVLGADPVSISDDDAHTLDALLDLRRHQRTGTAGPMPAGSHQRALQINRLLELLDTSVQQPPPADLLDRTLQRIQSDREQQQRTAVLADHAGPRFARSTGFSIRQLAATAALLMMVLSLLLPMLDMGRRDAMIAACNENLAGLGIDLSAFAFDNKDTIDTNPPGMFRELSGFAQTELDGSIVPPSQASLFILRDQNRVSPQHLACPSAASNNNAIYNGQNPIAGGPLRIFLKPRPIYADTNPLYRVSAAGLVRNANAPANTRSQNHSAAGQNVLISDGSVTWTTRPAFTTTASDDNIWLLDQPAADSDDVFLTP